MRRTGPPSASRMYSVYSTTLRTGGEKIRGGTTVAAARPSAAIAMATPAARSVTVVSVGGACSPYLRGGADQAATAAPTRMIAWRRSRNALARRIRMAATAPSTTSCAHCSLAVGRDDDPRGGHGDGGDAEQHAGQHGVGPARGGGDLLAGQRDVGGRAVLHR